MNEPETTHQAIIASRCRLLARGPVWGSSRFSYAAQFHPLLSRGGGMPLC